MVLAEACQLKNKSLPTVIESVDPSKPVRERGVRERGVRERG
jgi:hypothetical protein